MSIQAVAWALEQDFGYTTPKGRQTSAHGAKLVLISLCNHADHKTGHCWPSASTIAKEASCNIRSVYRLIGALERNGFIEVKRNRGGKDNKQRSNNYWIRFDRPTAPWQFFAGDDDDGPQDQHDTVSLCENVENFGPEPSENATESPTQCDMGVTRHIMPEPSVDEPSVPNGFNPNARAAEQAKLQAAEEARKPKLWPVIEGSAPWEAHVANGHPRTLVCNIRLLDGRRDRGWYFSTLWPPKPKQQSTGPPLPLSFMTPQDEKQFG